MNSQLDGVAVRMTDETEGKCLLRLGLKAVVVIVAVEVVVSNYAVITRLIKEIKFDRIQADNDQFCAALVTRDTITLFGFGIDGNFFTAFGTNRRGHWSHSP